MIGFYIRTHKVQVSVKGPNGGGCSDSVITSQKYEHEHTLHLWSCDLWDASLSLPAHCHRSVSRRLFVFCLCCVFESPSSVHVSIRFLLCSGHVLITF